MFNHNFIRHNMKEIKIKTKNQDILQFRPKIDEDQKKMRANFKWLVISTFF
jgi:hypothetical protein